MPVTTVIDSQSEPRSSGERHLRLLSIVCAVLDEEQSIREFCSRIEAGLGDIPYELIVVDDGSKDRTAALVRQLAQSNYHIKLIELARNFGHQSALTAGLQASCGDAVVTIDGDLQDPPELIAAMVSHWRGGSDVVYAIRESRPGDSRFKVITARWFYRLFARLTHVSLPVDVGDFRLMDRRAVTALLRMPERHRFLRGMTVWIGLTQTLVPYQRDARYGGKTKYPLRKMISFSLDAIFSFSNLPLQLATMLGFVISGFAFLAVPLTIIARINHQFVPGVSSTIVILSLLGGIQLITVGIIGEYVGRIYDEVKRRPLYVVQQQTNLDPDTCGVIGVERDSAAAYSSKA